MEVEQVSFNGERLGAEGGAIADVGHRIEALLRHAGVGDVNAIFGHEFFVAAEVDGGNGVFGAITAAAAGIGDDAESTAEQVAGIADITFCSNQLAHPAAGNGMAADAHLGVDLDFETELMAELGQLVYVAFGFSPETEVKPLVHLAGVQFAVQNLLGELARSEQRKVTVEGQQQHGIQASGSEQAQLDGQRSDQARRRIGMEDARGMRIKGYSQGMSGAEFPGAAYHLCQDVLVSAVHAVEVAHAQHSAAEIGGKFLEMAVDLQAVLSSRFLVRAPARRGGREAQTDGTPALRFQISNSSFRPSCARRTCGGREALVCSCGRSWQIWVKNARCGCRRSTMRTEFSTVECVGCGLCRSASKKRMSRFCSWANDASGMVLKSVR